MNCEQANQIDLVDYLNSIGHQPKKIKGADHWYLSPFREEKEPSFKVERNKNVWYDHGVGKGGKLVDFLMELHHCNVSEALEEIVSFHPQKNIPNNVVRSQFHSHQNNSFQELNERETAIKIIAAKQPIEDPFLCRYLLTRGIEKSMADKFCYDVSFQNFHAGEKKKMYKAIGFKNNAGGYELRNEYFKGSSSPKYVTYLNNKAKNIGVFEGFFDFLSYHSIHKNQEHELTNLPIRQTSFLILNSLAFFERSLLLMEKYERIHLYLDHDTAGRKYTDMALRKSVKVTDESKLYKGYKDLNEWLMNLGKLKKKINVGQSMHRHL